MPPFPSPRRDGSAGTTIREPQRRLGLSQNTYSGGAPLTINNNKSSAKRNNNFWDNEEDIHRPPVSSGDEDENAGTHTHRATYESSDDDCKLGDIPPSSFGRMITPSEPQMRRRKSAARSSASSSAQDVTSSYFKSSAKIDAFGRIQRSQPLRRNAPGYSKSNGRVFPSASLFSPSPQKKFKATPRVPSVPNTPEKSFKTQNLGNLIDSPISEIEFKNHEALSLTSCQLSPKIKFKIPTGLPESPVEEEMVDFRRMSALDDSMDEGNKSSNGEIETCQELVSQPKASFLIPLGVEELIGDLPSDIHGGLSQIAKTDFNETLQDLEQTDAEVPSQATCPMCGEIVDQDFLESFHTGRMTIRMQTRFCRVHKRRSAEEAWTSRGYPEINWDILDRRIAAHHQYLKGLLEGESSYYRDILEDAVKAGRNRNLKQAMLSSGDSLTPGYYGSRGQRLMSENIMNKFSPALRKIAVTDRLVSARGVTGYVQSVMVPELAAMLIQEDMGVDAESARDIMKESISLGDLVNEEEDDILERRVGD